MSIPERRNSQHKVPECLACLNKGQRGWQDNESGERQIRETAESQNPLQTIVKTLALADGEGALGEDGSGCC